MDFLLSCLGRSPTSWLDEKRQHDFKPLSHGPHHPQGYKYTLNAISYPRSAHEETAAAILDVLISAEKPSRNVNVEVQNIVAQAGGWTEYLAVTVLKALQKTLEDTSIMLKGVLKEAYDKGREAAKRLAEFAHDHPLYTAAICVAIALGVLIILSPCIIHALGFGILGPEAGKS